MSRKRVPTPSFSQPLLVLLLRAAFTDNAHVLFLHCGIGVRGGLCQYLSAQIPDLTISGADYAYVPLLSGLTLREITEGGVRVDADFVFASHAINRKPQDVASLAQHTYRNGAEVGQGKNG